MMQIEATFWAAEATSKAIKSLCAVAVLQHAAGTLNTRWQDFSAQELAADAGLQDVDWKAEADDTPGNLTLTFTASLNIFPAVMALLHKCHGVDDYKIYSRIDADGAAPYDSDGSLYGPVDS